VVGSSLQALFANRAHEPFRVGVGVRCLYGRQDNAHSRPVHDASESLRPLAVPVADEDPMACQEPVDSVSETSRRLAMKAASGFGVEPTTCTRRLRRSRTKSV
jgi:hypothetical protein